MKVNKTKDWALVQTFALVLRIMVLMLGLVLDLTLPNKPNSHDLYLKCFRYQENSRKLNNRFYTNQICRKLLQKEPKFSWVSLEYHLLLRVFEFSHQVSRRISLFLHTYHIVLQDPYAYFHRLLEGHQNRVWSWGRSKTT